VLCTVFPKGICPAAGIWYERRTGTHRTHRTHKTDGTNRTYRTHRTHRTRKIAAINLTALPWIPAALKVGAGVWDDDGKGLHISLTGEQPREDQVAGAAVVLDLTLERVY